MKSESRLRPRAVDSDVIVFCCYYVLMRLRLRMRSDES